MNRKLRLLYAGTHPTLRTSDIRAFLEAGFEVVPSFVYVQFRGQYRIDPKPLDSPLTEINREWKGTCSVPSRDVYLLQKVDLYKVSDRLFTTSNNDQYNVQNKYFADSGMVSEESADLINKYIDVIVVQSFPNVAAAILTWFKGIVVFRIFGNEDPDFSVWTHYKQHFYSLNSKNFFLYSSRYISLSVFSGIIETERKEILGFSPALLNSVNFDEIRKLTKGIRWKSDLSKACVATNISYLDMSPSWQEYYKEFSKVFEDIPFTVFGKNKKDHPLCRDDARIMPQIDDYREYLEMYCQFRVFCNVGKLKQHSQYTPFECASMGIPVLFLESSALAWEAKKHYAVEELNENGMCADLRDMAQRARECLEDVEVAKRMSMRQRVLFDRCFGSLVHGNQAKHFYATCAEKIKMVNHSEEIKSRLSMPDENRGNRILWAFYHKVNRYEEVPLWIEAGFEVVPITMPDIWKKYQGAEYDNELDPLYPRWRDSCTIEQRVLDIIRDISIISSDPEDSGLLSKEDIAILNNYFGYIYVPASASLCLNLLKSGYRGIILHRYFGYYKFNGNLTGLSRYQPINALKMYPNYIWLPAMSDLSRHESKSIAPKKYEVLVPYLRRNSEFFREIQWSADESSAVVATAISSISSELMHYYVNFLQYFGHLPYKIYGKNWQTDLDRVAIRDSDIVGSLPSEIDLYKAIKRHRVYIECGMVTHHSHYTPVEVLHMGVPLIFWDGSGIATELKRKFTQEQLFDLGMCKSWEDMALLAEKCLLDVEVARSLSEKQRVLRDFVSKEEVVASMKKVKGVARRIAKVRWMYSLVPLRGSIVEFLGFLEYLRMIKDTLVARFGSGWIVLKKGVYLGLVLVGLSEDWRGVRKKIKTFIKKALSSL